jgi:hypothetical protein
MLVALQVDTGKVISRTFRLIGFVCCLLVLASFAMFARDQMAGASARQQTALLPGAAASVSTSAPPKPHAQPRRFIDGAAKVLTTPFTAIIRSRNVWVTHGLPALFALIGYGLGLGFLARYSAART